MTGSIIERPPSGVLRSLLRLPIWLYRMRLGWLLGDRFLMLRHEGRRSGRVRETVIEVVRHDPQAEAFYVVSGWGPKSDWYLNITKNPDVTISAGGRQFRAHAETVAVSEAEDVLRGYSERHPLAFRELTALFLGERLRPGADGARRLAQLMPMVVFRGGE